ncbi:hypothetical protein BDV06DRAFT_126022 [Aspergillus oleicola]
MTRTAVPRVERRIKVENSSSQMPNRMICTNGRGPLFFSPTNSCRDRLLRIGLSLSVVSSFGLDGFSARILFADDRDALQYPIRLMKSCVG